MMTKENGNLWDNDTFSLPKTSKSIQLTMGMVYNRLLLREVDPTSQEAKDYSEGMPMTYKDWLAERTTSK